MVTPRYLLHISAVVSQILLISLFKKNVFYFIQLEVYTITINLLLHFY